MEVTGIGEKGVSGSGEKGVSGRGEVGVSESRSGEVGVNGGRFATRHCIPLRSSELYG